MSFNAIKYISRLFPPLFVFVKTIFIYFLFISECVKPLYDQNNSSLILILLGFSFNIMLLWIWCFVVLIFSDPGSLKNEITNNEKLYKYNMEEYKKGERICQICCLYKPMRAHHCRRCNKCFAKTDHHCFIIGKCIALRNQKTFIIFLLYSFILSVMGFVTSFYCSLHIYDSGNINYFNILIIFFSVIVMILVSYLLYQQIINLINDRTYIEMTYNQVLLSKNSKMQNILEVFGEFSVSWFYPIDSRKDINGYKWDKIKSN